MPAQKKLKIEIKELDPKNLGDLALFESDDLAISIFLNAQVGKEPFNKIKKEIDSITAEGNKLIEESTLEKRSKAYLKNKLREAKEFLWTYEIPENTKGLAIFLGRDKDYLLNLPFKIEREIKIKRIFHLKPLLEVLSRKQIYAVLLADRTEGRVMIIDRGKIKEKSEIIYDDVPRRTKSGESRSGFGTGGARSHDLEERRVERHIEFHLAKHLEKLAKLLFDHFWRAYKFKYLLVGSHTDLKHELVEKLHPYLKNEMKIFWSLDPVENIDLKRKKAEEYFTGVQQEEDGQIIKRLIEEIGRPNIGVSGVDETLDQLNQGRLGIIYISKNLNMTGYYTRSNFDLEVYPHEGKIEGTEEIHTLDLADAICRKAILTNTKIRFMENEELEKLGGLAGIFEKY